MNLRSFNGFLFIGDPHVSSKKIGRRKDDYLQSVLGKLSQCAQICNSKGLLPVILGDLFHKSGDNDLVMLNRLTRVLRQFETRPVVLDGNHDKQQTELSEADALDLINLGGSILLASQEALIEVVLVAGVPVRLWGCGHGADIPTELPEFDGTTVLITHHDLAFGASYPGALPLHEIKNCTMVVNGHMHDTKPSQKIGDTWWHNPGNIEPISISLKDQVPKAWEWTQAGVVEVLHGVELTHGTDLFDLVGTQVNAEDSGVAVAAWTGDTPQIAQSQFSELLKRQAESDALRTDDASVLGEDLADVLNAGNISEASKQLMQTLFAAMAAGQEVAVME